MNELVLSHFPGIGLLDMAFEEEGFCIVRGPDLLWGGDIRRFHPPPGKFDGVIGGPPCQPFSRLRHLIEHNGHKVRHEDQIPQFVRCVLAAAPSWFLMENVPAAPDPVVTGYAIEKLRLNNRWLGSEAIGPEQHRERCFWFGSREGRKIGPFIEWAVFESPKCSHAVIRDARAVPVAIGGSGKPKQQIPGRYTVRSLEMMCELQGLPVDFTAEMPFTIHGKRSVIGNGIPLPMGRAVAKAVRKALQEATP